MNNTSEKLFAMQNNEVLALNDDTEVIKMPEGWIYHIWDGSKAFKCNSK